MKKVLFVDDKFVFHMLNVEELEETGNSDFTRGNLERLINIIDEHEPDEVVMDIRAENYRGLDIMKDADKACHDLPFRLCDGLCGNFLKSMFCPENSETGFSEKKTARFESNREHKADHSFAA